MRLALLGALPLAFMFRAFGAGRCSISRVATRVVQGGHKVSNTIIRRRFDAGLRNFKDIYMHLVDKWEWYDNSSNTPQMIAVGSDR
jgi:predicted ABC-type ATPase